jgi:tetratricopeptide (TPR) repeat protein
VSRTRSCLVSLLLAAFVAVSFLGLARNGFVALDDNVYLGNNVLVRDGLSVRGFAWAWTTTLAGNWHPLTWLSHMLDVELFGMKPGAHHLVNLAIHGANTILLFLALQTMTGARWKSALVAAFFGMHPLHVESVAWASERKDVLSTFFELLALRAWLRHLRRPTAARSLSAVVPFALALLAKPMPISFPFVLLLFDWWPLGRWAPTSGAGAFGTGPPPPWRLVREKAPLLLLSAAAGAIAVFAQSRAQAVVSAADISLPARVANALVSYVHYLVHAAWPLGLAVFYPQTSRLPSVALVSAALLILIAATWLALRSSRRRPYVLVGWFWYLGALVPVIGLVQVGRQAMADRYTYLPLTGIFLLAVWALAESAAARPTAKKAAGLSALAMLLACAALTGNQVSHWRDSGTLFTRALATTRDNWMAHNGLGYWLYEQKMYDEAEAHLREASRLNPENFDVLFNRGLVATARGNHEEAQVFYQAVLLGQPENAEAHNNLGVALMNQGRLEESISHFEAALGNAPDQVQAHFNLARALGALGRPGPALGHYRRVLALDADNTQARNELGILLAGLGRTEEALSNFRGVLDREPGNAQAHNNIGNALGALHRADEAAEHYRAAIRIDPTGLDAHLNLGNLLVAAGNLPAAAAEFEAALANAPGNVALRFALGNALAGQGRFEDAIGHYRRILELDADHAGARVNLDRALALKK